MNSTNGINNSDEAKSLLMGSKTLKNLREILFNQSVLLMRYPYFTTVAEFEGMGSFSRLLKEVAESDIQIVQGCMDFLREVDEEEESLMNGKKMRPGGTLNNFNYLTLEWEKLRNSCLSMKETARREGFEDIVSWFETLEKISEWRIKQFREVHHGSQSSGD